MARTGVLEIIDLTESSPPPQPIVINSDEDDAEVKGLDGEKETRKPRRKRRKRRVPVEEGEVAESSAQPSRNQSTERNTDSTRDPPPRQRLRSPEPRRRNPSPRPQDNFTDLFVVDVMPAQVLASVKPTIPGQTHLSPSANKELDHSQLLLPEHVSVFGAREDGERPIKIIGPPPPNSEDEDEDFIEYLDYDDRNKGLVRYFDEVNEDSKPTRFVCKNCGAEGEHKTIDCPVQICLTCGARNEHTTRSCPISKTCYTCGMKGHINQNCPNRYNRGGMDSYDDCDRCGAITHKTNECPTLWRMYEYVSDDQRLRILQARETKQHLGIGEGGEGYIGGDEWCYNCGGAGHWGDDCNEVPHSWDFPKEPSAFSAHNNMSGPFFDPAAEPAEYQANYRDRGGDDSLPEGWGMDAPGDVGKQGRKKDRAKLEKRFQEQEENSDGGDWFANPMNARRRGMQPAASSNRTGPHAPRKMVFGSSMKEAGRQFQPLPVPERPKLIDRIQDADERSIHRNRHGDRRGMLHDNSSSSKRGNSSNKRSRNDRESRGSSGRYDWDRRRDTDRDDRYRDRRRDGDRVHRREDSGPRYTGGYSR